MGQIFSSQKEFSGKFPDLKERKERAQALLRYFERGGVISVSAKQKGWPRLEYPSHSRISQQITELREKKSLYERQYSEWKRSMDEANMYDVKNNVLKFADPIFWRHMAKYASDKDYKKAADSVKLPVNLVSDKRWKPMIRMFVDDAEYRHNLVETVNYSIVYKKDKTLAKYAKQLKEFRLDVSGRAIKEMKEKIGAVDKDLKALSEIASWVSDG